MKQAYKCDYCKFIGSKDEVEKHEITCVDNYDRRSCYTCSAKNITFKNGNGYTIKCKNGIEIPDGKIYEFCKQYSRKKTNSNNLVDLFEGFFN